MVKETNRHSGMFQGLTPSKGVQIIVERAQRLGLDPTQMTQKAADAAKRNGRNKVGFFGESGVIINSLREAVDSETWRQGQQARLSKSRPR